MRVFVYSPIRLFGEGLAACLQGDNAIEAVTYCHCADELAHQVTRFGADVALIDMAQEGGLRQGRALSATCPDVRIIALALPEASSEVISCVDAGFVSYVPRDAPLSQLRAIIAMAMRDEVQCNPKISGALLRELRLRRQRTVKDEPIEPLTRRECDALRLLGRGLSNKEIARQLGISEATVKNHVHEILAKLHVRRRAEAMARLRDEPWIAKVG